MKIRNPYFPSIANTWEQSQTFVGSANFDNYNTNWNANPVYWNFLNNSGPQFQFQGIDQFIINGSTTGVQVTVANYNGSKNQPVQLGVVPVSFAPTIASGTVYQNTTYSYQTLRIAAYAATAGTAGSVAVAMGTSSTPSTIETDYVSGGSSSTVTVPIVLRVPPQWYYSLTVSGAVLGSATGIQE